MITFLKNQCMITANSNWEFNIEKQTQRIIVFLIIEIKAIQS